MSETTVSDTGPILHLAEIGRLSELKHFQKVMISNQVKIELRQCRILSVAETTLSGKLEIQMVKPSEISTQQSIFSGFDLHRTDLSVVALALRTMPNLVLTDDLELRKTLESQGVKVIGSIGVLFRAFHNGHLNKGELRISLENLFDGSTLYLSKGIKKHVILQLDALADSP